MLNIGNSFNVCRDNFLFVHDISKRYWDGYSDKKKECIGDEAKSFRFHKYNKDFFDDAHIEPFNNIETENIFGSNVVDYDHVFVQKRIEMEESFQKSLDLLEDCVTLAGVKPGKLLGTARVDPNWTRSALTPLASRQHDAVLWIYDYFQTYAEQSPDRNISQLANVRRQDIYKYYENDFKYKEKVDFRRFAVLWNIILPRHLIRGWSDIPGKCWLCAELDRLQRTENSIVVQDALRRLRHLHRGGNIVVVFTLFLC
jgi:hypothetical protein